MSQSNLCLVEEALPIFYLINRFKTEKLDLFSFQNELMGALESFRNGLARQEMPAHWVEAAQYGLTALADEMMFSEIQTTDQHWGLESVQVKRFGSHLAGELFFEKLGLMRLELPGARPVVELYYWILKAGFRGLFRLQPEEAWLQYVTALGSALRADLVLVEPSPSSSARIGTWSAWMGWSAGGIGLSWWVATLALRHGIVAS